MTKGGIEGAAIAALALFLILAAGAFVLNLIGAPRTAHDGGAEEFPAATITIISESGAHTFSVEIADEQAERAKGLSGREYLSTDEGMLFLMGLSEKHGFWMKDMRFPLDIVWIQGNTIVGFSYNLEPEPERADTELTVYYPPKPVDKVLEISAGLAKKYGFHVGDTVSISRQKK